MIDTKQIKTKSNLLVTQTKEKKWIDESFGRKKSELKVEEEDWLS